MQLGLIGLGRMGANMARRLMEHGHGCVVFDTQPDAVQAMVGHGAVAAASLAELVAKTAAPRAIWLMVPAGFVDAELDKLVPLLAPGDTVVDGGNSNYRDAIRRAARLADAGLHFVDVGTSGGIAGRERGYCLMIGGDDAAVGRLEPIFSALAPGPGAEARTEGRGGDVGGPERGFLHCGPPGAGHFVKMVHNGIEYGLMAAFAEGFAILKHADAGKAEAVHDAETAPMREPELYRYTFDLPAIAEVWRRGSVIGSWLLDLTAAALLKDPALDGYGGRVSDSGEGRWTVQAAIDEGVPAHVLSAALFDRYASRGGAGYANKVLSAMRHAFGGHVETKA